MALITAHFYSKTLGMQRSMDVVLPQETNGVGMEGGASKGAIPVMYLLHGWSDDHTIWQRRTSIERYATERGLAVVMPSTDMGFYNDMRYGYDFWRFFSEELYTIVADFFPCISTLREDTFVAGLSMGGFGALKLGLNFPERFAAVASLSGLTDPLWEYTRNKPKGEWYNSFGDIEEMRGSVNDIHFMMEKLIGEHENEGRPMPVFFQACGTEDFLYEINVKFHDKFKDRIDLTYLEEPGTHEWGFWDRNIKRVIDWLPLKLKSDEKGAE
jgi:S-formylglutathione hydrolase FrmB